VSTKNVPLLALDFLARIVPCGSMNAPLFPRFSRLWLSMMAGGRTGFPLLSFATCSRARVDSFQRAVICHRSK